MKISNKKDKLLTSKQKLFLQFYLTNGYNGTKAAIDAGYSEDSAKQIAYENLTKPYLKRLIQKHLANNQKRFEATIDDIEQWLLSVFNFDWREANKEGATSIDPLPWNEMPMHVRRSLMECSRDTAKDGTHSYYMKPYNKFDAIQLLMKHFGLEKNNEIAEKKLFSDAIERLQKRFDDSAKLKEGG